MLKRLAIVVPCYNEEEALVDTDEDGGSDCVESVMKGDYSEPFPYIRKHAR